MNTMLLKKKLLMVSLTLVGAFSSSLCLAHPGEESRITIELENQGNFKAGMIPFAFQVFDSETQKTLSDKDLVETHTKILHMIAYDPSRNEFNHVHPSFDGKLWSTELNLAFNGSYFVWAQGQLADGTEFSTYAKANIVDGKPSLQILSLGENRKATDRLTTLELDKTKIKAGKSVMINFKVTREDGQKPKMAPYLGALAHVIAVSPDGDELIHVHPMAGSGPNTGMIHATFPTEGDYRLWVQFIEHDELKTIPLSVVVTK